MAIKEKVLVVEDNDAFQQLFTNQVGGIVELLQARSQREALDCFNKHPGIALIVLDGLVPKVDPQNRHEKTTGLAQMLRMHGFNGKILAYSSDEKINEELMDNGCTAIIHNKTEGPPAVLRELGIA